jgi:hypothetical protein
MFIETENYIGPDRRFRKAGPPAEFGVGRRKEDAENAAAAEAVAGNEPSSEVQETTA